MSPSIERRLPRVERKPGLRREAVSSGRQIESGAGKKRRRRSVSVPLKRNRCRRRQPLLPIARRLLVAGFRRPSKHCRIPVEMRE